MFAKINTRSLKTLLVHCVRPASSALFINGEKAQETFSVLIPHFDFNTRIQDKSKFKQNIQLRRLPYDLDEIEKVWKFYLSFKMKKVKLEQSKIEIAKQIQNLSKRDVEELEKLKAHGKMIKEDLKAFKEHFYQVEENTAIKVLALPNVLHEKTPGEQPVICHTHKEKPTKPSAGNVEIGTKSNCLEYHSPKQYYLKNNAALFELCSSFYFDDKLLQNNFVRFANSDFARSVIVEGCGLELDRNHVFTLEEENQHENSRLHLTGGASLSAFMAYHAKHTVYPTQLPLKYFTSGRKYNPVSQEHSLFNVSQETAVDIFIATADNDDDMNKEFENVLNFTINTYESLGYHFRASLVPANELLKWESLRVSIQMYSCFKNSYVEVGNISICDDYVSKRLLFNYGKGYDVHFPKVIYGNILSVPKVLGCLLESDEDILPDLLQKYVIKHK